MLPYAEATNIIKRTTWRDKQKGELCLLDESCGRILASEILCPEDNPAFDNSAMDGFALQSELTTAASAKNPVEVPIFQTLGAGETSSTKLPHQVALEIMTGAEIPANYFNTVVRLEDVRVTEIKSERKLIITEPILPNKNIRTRGSDLKSGEVLLSSGTLIQPFQMMALATFGISSVPVLRQPSVVLISTGKELVDYRSSPPSQGHIRNSSAPFLERYLKELGCRVNYLGIVDDDVQSIKKVFQKALSMAPDLIISTGGVSVGCYDWVEPVLRELDAKIHFHKCAIRPGKPILFASLGPTNIFGVPGNPISSAVAARFFINPYLRSFFGLPEEKYQQAVLTNDVKKPEGLRTFLRAKSFYDKNCLHVEVLPGQESYRLRSSLVANSWVVIYEPEEFVKKGTCVDVCSLYGHMLEVNNEEIYG